MQFLSEKEELCLKFLLARKNNVGFGNDDEIYVEDIENEDFTFSHFQTLEKEGYIEARIFENYIVYYLTSKAIDYFDEKEKHIESTKEEKRLVTKRYWLDKIIPLIALVVSIIAFLNSIFKWWEV